VNYSRFIGVNPEFALNGSTNKFSKRFYTSKKNFNAGENASGGFNERDG